LKSKKNLFHLKFRPGTVLTDAESSSVIILARKFRDIINVILILFYFLTSLTNQTK
jgi:hypothetical protein